MTTSSPDLDMLKAEALDSYINWTPAERDLIQSSQTFDEFDQTMHALVAKYNDFYKQ